MQRIIFDKNQLYLADNSHYTEDSLDFLEGHSDAIIRFFTRRKMFYNLLGLYGHKHDLEGYILLNAHGGVRHSRWVFLDGKEVYNVQDWIDQIDGSALAILLDLCNPQNHHVHSKKSVIMHPTSNVNLQDIIKGGCMRIYIPGEGYLEDNYYKLKKTIDKLLY